METFGDRMREARERLGMSKGELARRVGWSTAYVSRIEANKRLVDSLPPYHQLRLVAEVLGVPHEWLAGEPQPPPIPPRRRLSPADLFDRFGIAPHDAPLGVDGVAGSAGPGIGVPQDIDDTLPRRRKKSRHLYEVLVRGSCMEDDVKDGELLIYSDRLPPEIGKIVVALRDEEELLIKRLTLDGERQVLRSNGDEAIPVDERIRFLGRAVAAQRRLL